MENVAKPCLVFSGIGDQQAVMTASNFQSQKGPGGLCDLKAAMLEIEALKKQLADELAKRKAAQYDLIRQSKLVCEQQLELVQKEQLIMKLQAELGTKVQFQSSKPGGDSLYVGSVDSSALSPRVTRLVSAQSPRILNFSACRAPRSRSASPPSIKVKSGVGMVESKDDHVHSGRLDKSVTFSNAIQATTAKARTADAPSVSPCHSPRTKRQSASPTRKKEASPPKLPIERRSSASPKRVTLSETGKMEVSQPKLHSASVTSSGQFPFAAWFMPEPVPSVTAGRETTPNSTRMLQRSQTCKVPGLISLYHGDASVHRIYRGTLTPRVPPHLSPRSTVNYR